MARRPVNVDQETSAGQVDGRCNQVWMSTPDWKPAASLRTLRLRAELITRIRAWFSRRGLLEVETPVLSVRATTDPAIESFSTISAETAAGARLYLHSSPEFPMKRLLAAGSGSIYQICRVFRRDESGRFHNPEFTLLEWYRVGYDHYRLMQEVGKMLQEVLDGMTDPLTVSRWSYQELFLTLAGVDPLSATVNELSECLKGHGITSPQAMPGDNPDPWLDLLMTHVVQPQLQEGIVFVHDYPASQAALARISETDERVAERFEVFLHGIELANGFHELADAVEQRRRFEEENRQRRCAGRQVLPIDTCLIDALAHGLPDCAGVALGVDRLLMIAAGVRNIAESMAFPMERS